MRMRKILVMGLPGAGKTTLATALAPLLNAVVFNADAVRANISRDLGFDHADRIEHARRMGWICDRVAEAGGTVIADFVCPTEETRAAFGNAFHDLARPHQRQPLRGHQSHVRSTQALRSSRLRGGHAAILGRTSACSAAPVVRSAKADGLVPRTLLAVVSRPPAIEGRCFTPRTPPRRESASRCRRAI